jgi:hypothetical protein
MKKVNCAIDLTSDRKNLSLYDIRFVELYNEASEIAKRGGGELCKWRTRIAVGPLPDPSDTQHVQMLRLNGKWYSFTPCLKDRATAARDGLMGSQCVNWGTFNCQVVEARIAHEQDLQKLKMDAAWKKARKNKAYSQCESLWGDELAPAIWRYNNDNAHPEVKQAGFAKTVRWALTWLRSSDKAEGKLPPTIAAALANKYLARGITTKADVFWALVVPCTEYLFVACPVPAAPWRDGHAPENPGE